MFDPVLECSWSHCKLIVALVLLIQLSLVPLDDGQVFTGMQQVFTYTWHSSTQVPGHLPETPEKLVV